MTTGRRESKADARVLLVVAVLALGFAPPALAQSSGLVGARPLAGAAVTIPTATASSATVEQTGDSARLVFDLSAPVKVSAFALADPDRIIVDLPEVDFQLDPLTGKPAPRTRSPKPRGLINSFRFGLLAPGKSRIVIDLGGPARIVRAVSLPASDHRPGRLVVEVAKTDRAGFRALVRGRAMALVTDPPVALPAPGPIQKPVIVLDPGHGGIDSGAMVNGLVEKFVVFDFAKALAAKLEATGKFKVVLTRDQDVFIPLAQRVRIAHDSDASLLVSIHADTLSDASDVTGATVYTLSDRASDAEAARVAEKENQADAAAGLEGQEVPSGVSDILFDLTRRETRAYSHVFSRTLINYWRAAGRLNKNPQRSAGFRVLMAPDVPSVLLELGYLSNDRDAAALSSPEWRDKASAQVAAAIERFFAARTAARPDVAPDLASTGTIRAAAAIPAGATLASAGAALRGAHIDVAHTSQPRDIDHPHR